MGSSTVANGRSPRLTGALHDQSQAPPPVIKPQGRLSRAPGRASLVPSTPFETHANGFFLFETSLLVRQAQGRFSKHLPRALASGARGPQPGVTARHSSARVGVVKRGGRYEVFFGASRSVGAKLSMMCVNNVCGDHISFSAQSQPAPFPPIRAPRGIQQGESPRNLQRPINHAGTSPGQSTTSSTLDS